MTNLNFKQAKGFVTVSTTVDPEAHKFAKHNKISWARALDIGLKIIFNEIDPIKHPLPKVLQKKVDKMVDKRG